jgi:hypothetical protein
MSNTYRDFDIILEAQDLLFPQTSFGISCFDSVKEITMKTATYYYDTIIIQYRYRLILS